MLRYRMIDQGLKQRKFCRFTTFKLVIYLIVVMALLWNNLVAIRVTESYT